MIEHVKGQKEKYVSYHDYPYGFFGRSYRGHWHLVLSQEKHKEREFKKIVNKCVWTNMTFMDDSIVIMVNNMSLKDREHIKAIVSAKVSLLYCFFTNQKEIQN